MTIFYFTSTGNSLAVAKAIGGKLISIPQVMDAPQRHYKDDVIGVVFPVYGLLPAKIVQDFLDKVKFEAEYTFAIGTYGNMPGGCMRKVQKQAEKNGCRFDYANDILMLDNFLPVFEMGAEMEKLPRKKAQENLAKIVEDIHSRKHRTAEASIGGKILTAMGPLMSPNSKGAQKYLVNDRCNQCGTCAKVCPTKNIAVADKVIFSDCCAGCLACLHHCPQNAIHLKNEKSAIRWRNPDVSLGEIISANSRTNL